MRKGNISEVGGTSRLQTLSAVATVFAFLLFRNIFCSQAQAIVGFEKNDILLL